MMFDHNQTPVKKQNIMSQASARSPMVILQGSDSTSFAQTSGIMQVSQSMARLRNVN